MGPNEFESWKSRFENFWNLLFKEKKLKIVCLPEVTTNTAFWLDPVILG